MPGPSRMPAQGTDCNPSGVLVRAGHARPLQRVFSDVGLDVLPVRVELDLIADDAIVETALPQLPRRPSICRDAADGGLERPDDDAQRRGRCGLPDRVRLFLIA